MLRRVGFGRFEIVKAPPAPLSPATRTASYSGTTQAVPERKKASPGRSRAAEIRHKEKLAALGCMVCRRLYPHLEPGPVELHHLRENGWGRGPYLTLMPLCMEHHRGATGVHGLGTRGFVKFYGFTQADMLRDALALVGGTE
jgi:hypothetical protein